ncbi:hypothetical protein Z043_102716 [Scleropages formosus]|uniref:Uncharacterized protein n=1 Tax=Scleropages formosus TaxID=113540 RepID=A0A0P7UTR4_SCLFO|nr:hypothetical protein Z043_102716 [Scleropages formosus]
MDLSPVMMSYSLTSRRLDGIRGLSPQPQPPAARGDAHPPHTLSPVTSLARNMTSLAVLGSHCYTPERRAVPLLKIPSFQSDASLDVGQDLIGKMGFSGGVTVFQCVFRTSSYRFAKATTEAGKVIIHKMPLRRIHSLPADVVDSGLLPKGRDLKPKSCGAVCEQDAQHDMGYDNKENMFKW